MHIMCIFSVCDDEVLTCVNFMQIYAYILHFQYFCLWWNETSCKCYTDLCALFAFSVFTSVIRWNLCRFMHIMMPLSLSAYIYKLC